ncbi:hypothetical protein GCM10011515_07530 [Tsuneonella deserti]|uniref:FG-GAP repeat protein n=1 Tax=Tsuneonella deserti TaxID=2035528 RepID=A0ABQ1S1R2_9SPHN|nr:VCBS repeat-containing protein [Tsuneonella deserti]GGD90422.1 hypothetical protein GCM10011515_07530 [Tsuneonella deserti]
MLNAANIRPYPLMLAALVLTACTQGDANADTGNLAANDSVQDTGSLASSPSTAAPGAARLPAAALAAWEGYAREQCRAIGERFSSVRFTPLSGTAAPDRPDRGGFVATDFNGDGKPDFVVVTSGQGCSGEGPGPGATDFVISRSDGYRAVEGFAGALEPQMVKQRDGKDFVEFPGGYFGNCGEVAVSVWGWSGQEMEVVERRDSKGQRVDKEGCALAAQSKGAAGSKPPLPFEPGYWAGGVSCTEAIEEAAELPPDEASLHYLTATGGYIGRFEIQRFQALGGNRYRLIGREHDENGSTPSTMDITVGSRKSFTDSRYGGRYTYCPTSTVSRTVRSYYENR